MLQRKQIIEGSGDAVSVPREAPVISNVAASFRREPGRPAGTASGRWLVQTSAPHAKSACLILAFATDTLHIRGAGALPRWDVPSRS